ncbi:MAG: tandem-95 repeat protein, partial [Cyanobacteria bacterium Co-bin8]|nr:tandem-95 repeat protein [Cyanobacteria bacterium Co-bin8]
SYTISVSDGVASTAPVAAEVTFNRVNDNPEITINQFAVSEGGTVILSSANISATDEVGETPQAELKYTVGNVQGGRFALATASTVAITSFTQVDINKSRVVFVHDGSDTTPNYTLTVTDSEGGTDVESSPTVTFTRVNQAPELVNNKLSILEGGTVVLSQANLLTNDEESAPNQLTYQVSGLSGGEFRVNGVATTTFTQADINGGLVSFVHNGTNAAPEYTVTVTDTVPAPPVVTPAGPFSATGKAAIAFTPVNDAPAVTASAFEIQEGATVVLSSAVLSAADEETTNPAQLIYTVDQVSNGEFQFVATGAMTTSFTQDDINNNRVQFKHDDSELAPSYTLTVKDSGLSSDAASQSTTTTVTFPEGPGGFINVNNLPVFLANQLEVQEGNKIVLSASNLSATDDDDIVSQLTFRIFNVSGGTFYLDGKVLDDKTTFTTSLISFGKLSFQDDGDETPATYTVEVTDPSGGVKTQAATVKLIPVNDNPRFVTNAFVINEDGLLELSSANLLAQDDETIDPTKITYTISNLTGGTFVLFSGGEPITTFTQAQVTRKEIVFLQNGSEVAPSFTIKVSDPEGGETTTKANITFNATNDLPVLGANSLTISEGGTVLLTPSNLSASDPDNLPSELVFTISGLAAGQGQFEVDKDGDGTFETVGATNFTLQDVTNGRVRFVDDGDETAPTYGVSVSDGTTSTAVQAAQIAFTNVNDLPVANDDSGTGFTTNQNTTFTTANVLKNDSDGDPGAVLTITEVDGKAIAMGGPAVELASGALMMLNSNGTFTYNPNGKFNSLAAGTNKVDSFTYTLSDGQGGSDTATVQIVVNGVNDNPVANDDSGQGFSTNEGTPLTTPTVLANDSDIDLNDTLTITQVDGKAISVNSSVTLTSGASVTLNANGTFNYNPNGKFESLGVGKTAVDSFTYTLSDANGGSDPATVSIVINGLNDAPVAVKDSGVGFSTNEDTPFKTGSVLANDTDIDGDTLSIIQVNGSTIAVGGPAITIASGAKVSLNSDGTFNYDPAGKFENLSNGDTKIDSFTYAISDGNGGTSTATVEVAISGLNDAPVAGNDQGAVSERRSLKLNVLANDRDSDPGDTLTIGKIGETAIAPGGQVALASGSLVILNSDSTLTYVPFGFAGLASGQVGSDSFTYSLVDSQGQSATATVSLQIAGYTPPAAVNGVFDYEQFARYALLDANTEVTFTPFEVGGLALDQLFDEGYYLSQYSDVAAAVDAGLVKSGYEHFITAGWLEGRNPSTLYNETFYISQNSDIAQAVGGGA